MKGIILAGGSGTCLCPLVSVTSKQLLLAYGNPMTCYSLSTLLLAGIRDILVISTPTDLSNFKRLLSGGSQFGIRLSYVEQSSSDGLVQTFVISEEFVASELCALVLDDSIFRGNGLSRCLRRAVEKAEREGAAVVFGYHVDDIKSSEPCPYGIYNLVGSGRVASWIDVAERVFELRNGNADAVQPASTAEYYANAKGVDFAQVRAFGARPRQACGRGLCGWEMKLVECFDGDGGAPCPR